MLSRKLCTYLKHVPESVQIKRVTLFVHLEFDGVLVVRSSIPEFLHVDSRETCSDQKGLIKRISTANHEMLFSWYKSIVQSLLLFFSETYDSAKKESIQFI
ncbi:hypothetical protein Tco_1184289 [Tanacetum coccineum]